MDLSMNLFRIPKSGETLIDDGGVAYLPGGKGANAAVAFAKLGAKTALAAKLGVDTHGQQLYDYYRDIGIDTSYIRVDRENPTGLAVVMKESDGNNRIVVYPGANSTLTADDVRLAFSMRPEAVYLNFEIPYATVLDVAALAAERRIPIIIDAAPAKKSFDLSALPQIEIFTPNETETYEFTGIMPIGSSSSFQAAMMLYKMVNARYIVIKQGERGAFVYNGKHHFMIPSMKAGKVVDTTAAGDTFSAAMTIEYLRTGDITEAVKYGTAAAAIAVTRMGASTSVPSEDEVRRLLSLTDL